MGMLKISLLWSGAINYARGLYMQNEKLYEEYMGENIRIWLIVIDNSIDNLC